MWVVKTTLDPASPEEHAHAADSAPQNELMPKHGLAVGSMAITGRNGLGQKASPIHSTPGLSSRRTAKYMAAITNRHATPSV